MNRLFRTSRLAAAAFSLYVCAGVASADPRPVEVTVTMRAPGGAPIADLPVCVRGASSQGGAVTDDAGVAVAQVQLQPGETRVAVQFELSCGTGAYPSQPFWDLVTTMVADEVYWVEVPEDEPAASLTIALEPVVFVSGRAVDGLGHPIKANGMQRAKKAISIWKEDGRFRIPVRVQEETELYFMPEGNRIRFITVPALAQDLDLGDVQVPVADGNAAVRITLVKGDQVDHRIEHKGGGVSLISEDGQTVLSFAANREGVVLQNPSTDELPMVPAGTYYVTPGLFGNSLSFKVLDAVRAGTDLAQTAVPRIVAVDGQQADLTLDVPAAEAAINAVENPPKGL